MTVSSPALPLRPRRSASRSAARARALRQEMDQKRQALRSRLQRQRQEAQARLSARRRSLQARRRPPTPQEARQRRRQRGLLLLLLLLLLCLPLRDCACTPTAPVLAPIPPPVLGVGVPGVAADPDAPPARVARRDRPSYPSAAPAPLPWVDAFRLQVAARSPRLAACFVGAARPGAIRWTTAVEPSQGRVSAHTLEPISAGDMLTAAQRDCVLEVLSSPTYRLEAHEERATPARVSMVIEF